ncbi:MAG: phage major capsid protein [Chthoniobacter sp.]|nr:phage major capsid protein [Chthoniobacter sp.]
MKRINRFKSPTGTNRNFLRRVGSQEQPMDEPWQMLHEQQQQEGPALLTPEEFQKKVLTSVDDSSKQVKTLSEKMGEVTSKLENADKETKKAFEDLAKVQKENADLSTKLLAVQKAQLQVQREVQTNWGNPIERFTKNAEVKELINALIRHGLEETTTARHDEILKGYSFVGKRFGITPEQKDISEGATPGSTYLRDQLSKMIYDALPDFGIWNTLGTEDMGTKNLILPVDTADPIAQVIAEAGNIADDANITGTSVTAIAKKIAVLLNVSRELLQDSEYDVTARVVKKFLRAVAKRMDYIAFMSDGTNDGNNGAFTGVFNFGTQIVAATGNTTVEAFDFEDITKTVLGVAEAVLDRAARWWMHPFILVRMLSIKDGNGRPIFLNALEVPTPGGLGSILGFPVTLGHVLPTTNTANNPVMAFGDPEAYVIGRRQDYEFDFSDHARWTNDQRSFRGISRAAFKGRLAAALTVLFTAAV